jgi:small-conductance mechanosensitive channel
MTNIVIFFIVIYLVVFFLEFLDMTSSYDKEICSEDICYSLLWPVRFAKYLVKRFIMLIYDAMTFVYKFLWVLYKILTNWS